MALIKHTDANRDFFAPGSAPTRGQWVKWIRSDTVPGKIIDGKPYIDSAHFAATKELARPARPDTRARGRALLE